MKKALFALVVFSASANPCSASLYQTADSSPVAARTSTLASNDSKEVSKLANNRDPKRANEEAKKYYKLGIKYGRAKLFQQAATALKQATLLNPSYADAYYGLGHAYFDLGRWQEAIEALHQVVKLDPKDDEAYAKLGEAYERLRAETNSVRVGSEVSLATGFTPEAKPEKRDTGLSGIYRVGIGDVLEIRLRDAPPDQPTLYTVSASGLLEHPSLARPIKVADLTSDEISKRIEADLRNRAVNERPEVFVGVRDYVSHTILVSGLVKDSGTKVLRREGIPLYVVIADAQPLPEANRAVIISHQTGQVTAVELSNPAAMNLVVRPGDVITLQPSVPQFFYVGGDVKAPGEKSFRLGITLTQAILAAGGLSRKANEAQLARESTHGLLAIIRIKLKDVNKGKIPDPLIQAGDRIVVAH